MKKYLFLWLLVLPGSLWASAFSTFWLAADENSKTYLVVGMIMGYRSAIISEEVFTQGGALPQSFLDENKGLQKFVDLFKRLDVSETKTSSGFAKFAKTYLDNYFETPGNDSDSAAEIAFFQCLKSWQDAMEKSGQGQ